MDTPPTVPPTVTARQLLADHPAGKPKPHPLREILEFALTATYYAALFLLAFAITALGCGLVAYAIRFGWEAGKL